jgi:hypothetical protein
MQTVHGQSLLELARKGYDSMAEDTLEQSMVRALVRLRGSVLVARSFCAARAVLPFAC